MLSSKVIKNIVSKILHISDKFTRNVKRRFL